MCSGLHLGLHESVRQPSKATMSPRFQTHPNTKKAPAFLCKCLNHKGLSRPFPWSHLGLNQGPPDYESGATNQLSYGTVYSFLSGNSCVGLRIICRSFTQVNSLLRRLSALDLVRNKLRLVLKSGQFRRWTAHPLSVIYTGKLPPSSLVRVGLGPK